MTRRLVLVLAASLAPLLLAFIWLEARRPEEPGAPPPGSDAPTIVFRDHVERVRTRQGEVSWQFEADEVGLLESGDYLIRGLRRGQYRSGGRSEVDFRADRARYEARTRNLAAVGHVKAVARRGIEFDSDAVYWFESGGRLVVPRIQRLIWRDPAQAPAKPPAPPAEVTTQRLFLFPREQRLQLPDPVRIQRGRDTLEAASADARLAEGRLRLAGPAKIDARVNLAEAGASGPAQVMLEVQRNGEIGYNTRGGSAVVVGPATVTLPGQQVRVAADRALYSGEPARTVRASGNVQFSDPGATLSAQTVMVDTRARRAAFGGPVALTATRPGAGAVQAAAPAVNFWYAAGSRRALLTGGVQMTVEGTRISASQADVNLESEVAVVTGAVRLVHTPGPAPGADEWARQRRRPVTVTCTRLTHRFGGPGRSEATGAVVADNGEWRVTGQRLTFDHGGQVLVVEGDVRVTNRRGERARARRLTYHVARDELEIETPAAAEIYLEGD